MLKLVRPLLVLSYYKLTLIFTWIVGLSIITENKRILPESPSLPITLFLGMFFPEELRYLPGADKNSQGITWPPLSINRVGI